MGPVRRVVVAGGGAGYFAALALRRELPGLDVTLVETSKIPIIGVGEATTTLMPAVPAPSARQRHRRPLS